MTVANSNVHLLKSSNMHTNTFHASNRPILPYMTNKSIYRDLEGRDVAVFFLYRPS